MLANAFATTDNFHLMNESSKGSNYITQASSRLMGLFKGHPEIIEPTESMIPFEEPRTDPTEQLALDLLRTAKKAADQETTDRARAIHERALKQDHRLTLIGQLGSEAIGLYQDFNKRELYFMRGVGVRTTRPGLRGIDKYASYIAAAEGYALDSAKKIAKSEWGRRNEENRSNQMAERFAKTRGYKLVTRSRYGGGRHYRSPAFNEVDAELLGSNALVSQSWVAETSPPFNKGLTVNLFHRLDESTQGMSKKSLAYSITLPKEDLSIVECVNIHNQELFGSDLLHPLGILMAAREAVRGTVPNRISKKW